MTNRIETLKKTNGETRLEPRAPEQSVSAEQTENAGDRRLSDEKFSNLFDNSQFETENISAEILFEKFYKNARTAFFKSFRDRKKTLAVFRRSFGDAGARFFVERAEKIIAGKFDLQGFENLDFGARIDWHFDPISQKRAPLEHWKQFDGFSITEAGDARAIRELNRCRHFFNLGVAFWLTNDERFAETFARRLESWIKENPTKTGVNWSSSFEVALRSISWVWALQFFKDSPHLKPELFLKTLESLHAHAAHIEKYLSTYLNPNTHLTGEALGLYYLGTQLPFFRRAAAWRETGEKILLSELDRQLLPDGVYFERSNFRQRCTTDFYTHFYILNELNGGENKNDNQSKLGEKIKSSLNFLMSIARPDGTTPLVGEGEGSGIILPLSGTASNGFRAALSTGAAIFRRGDYKFAAAEFAEETLWLLGADGEENFENLEAKTPDKNSFAFQDGDYFAMRDGWAETDNYLLMDGSALSIDATIGGKSLLVDAGNCALCESGAAKNCSHSTAARRNTLTIGVQAQSDSDGTKFDRQADSKTGSHRWISQERFDFYEGSRDGGEKKSGAQTTKHTRSVLFLKNDYWIMRDFVETSGEHDYALDFHFAAGANPKIETTESGDFVGEQSGENFGSSLFCFGDNANWKQGESLVSPVQDERAGDARHLKFVSKGDGAQEFFTFLLSRETGFAAPQVSEVSLSGGRAFVVDYRAYRDIFVFTDGGGRIVRTELFNTNFRFFWARLSEGEQTPEEFVLLGGTYFSLGKREIINHSSPLELATARRFGSRLNVRTDDGVFSVSLPQKKTTTYILKNENQDY